MMISYFDFAKIADLVSLVDAHNFITRPLGVNIRRKVNGQGNVRLHLLHFILWFDSIYTALLAFIPTEEEELLLVLGDSAFMLFDKKRYLFYAVVVFYRVSSAAMVTVFLRNDFQWMREANVIFNQLKTRNLYNKMLKQRKRYQIAVVWVILFRASMIVSAHSMAVMIYFERDSKYFLVHSYLYLVYYAAMYTSVNIQFMGEMYFLCRICIALFDEINVKCFYSVVVRRQKGAFQLYYHQFSQACLFVHRVMSYVRPIYVVFFVCNLIVDIFVLFNGVFANNGPIFTSFFLGFSFAELSIIVFFSRVIGQIDLKAKHISDVIYREYIISRSPYGRLFKSKV